MSAKLDQRRPCPVADCQNFIKPGQQICPACWYLVPGKYKQQVYHESRHHPGQASHQLAIAAAVEAVETNRQRGKIQKRA